MKNIFKCGDLVKVTPDPKCRTCYRARKSRCLCNQVLMLINIEDCVEGTCGELLPTAWTAINVNNREQYSVYEDWIHPLNAQ